MSRSRLTLYSMKWPVPTKGYGKRTVTYETIKYLKGEEEMHKDFFDVLDEVYTTGGIGNALMLDFYEHRVEGGSESQFARLAVYMEWEYGIKNTKHIKTEHIYELLELFRRRGFKEATLKSYISAFRKVCKRNQHLFLEDFEIPTNEGFTQWVDKKTKQW